MPAAFAVCQKSLTDKSVKQACYAHACSYYMRHPGQLAAASNPGLSSNLRIRMRLAWTASCGEEEPGAVLELVPNADKVGVALQGIQNSVLDPRAAMRRHVLPLLPLQPSSAWGSASVKAFMQLLFMRKHSHGKQI